MKDEKKDVNGIANISYVHDGSDDVIVGIERVIPKGETGGGQNEPSGTAGEEEPRGAGSEEVAAFRVLTPDEKAEKKRILKNIIIISFAFFFLFTSYNGMTNLQSSINKVSGTAALTALYVAFIISCCLLPSWVLKTLQEKKTMYICMLIYSFYMIAQFYPKIYTLLPGAIVLGIAAAPLWSAKCTYLTKVSDRYSELAGERREVIVTRFFGIFFLFFQSTQVVGNLISSLVMSIGIDTSLKYVDEEALSKCGYHFCIGGDAEVVVDVNGTTISSAPEGPPLWQIYTMAVIFLACALISAVVILVFLDPLTRFTSTQSSDSHEGPSTWKLLVATFNHVRHPYQILIIPLTVWSGLEQQFLSTDFTAAYISCAIGVHIVGYTIVCYGVCDAVSSYGFSPIVKKVGRVPVFTIAFVINLVLIIGLMKWRPHPDDFVWFFVISGLWGVADAVWQTQINSLYGVIFPGESEAAFSNYRLWESFGFFIAYMTSSVLCTNAKIIILFIFLIPGMVCYYIIEFLEKKGALKRDENGRVIPIDKLILGRS